jgi:hypothetical protein
VDSLDNTAPPSPSHCVSLLEHHAQTDDNSTNATPGHAAEPSNPGPQASQPDTNVERFEDDEGAPEEGEAGAVRDSDVLLQHTQGRGPLIDGVTNVAPGEGNRPHGWLTDEHAEEKCCPSVFMGHPRTLPQMGASIEWAQRARHELLHRCPRAREDGANVLVKFQIKQVRLIIGALHVRVRKATFRLRDEPTRALTVQDALNQRVVEQLLQTDQAYKDLAGLRTSADYARHSRQILNAMVRQLGQPAWFFTFSSRDSRWTAFLNAIRAAAGKPQLSKEEWDAMPFMQRCDEIQADPVTTARMYQRRLDALLKHVLMDCPAILGRVLDL